MALECNKIYIGKEKSLKSKSTNFSFSTDELIKLGLPRNNKYCLPRTKKCKQRRKAPQSEWLSGAKEKSRASIDTIGQQISSDVCKIREFRALFV